MCDSIEVDDTVFTVSEPPNVLFDKDLQGLGSRNQRIFIEKSRFFFLFFEDLFGPR